MSPLQYLKQNDVTLQGKTSFKSEKGYPKLKLFEHPKACEN